MLICKGFTIAFRMSYRKRKYAKKKIVGNVSRKTGIFIIFGRVYKFSDLVYLLPGTEPLNA